MSGTQPQDLPSGENPGDLADYAALPDDSPDDDVIDISVNEGPELTTGVADVDTGAAISGGGGTAARGDDTGTETPPTVIPDDEP